MAVHLRRGHALEPHGHSKCPEDKAATLAKKEATMTCLTFVLKVIFSPIILLAQVSAALPRISHMPPPLLLSVPPPHLPTRRSPSGSTSAGVLASTLSGRVGKEPHLPGSMRACTLHRHIHAAGQPD